jgi:hypothetical protein
VNIETLLIASGQDVKRLLSLPEGRAETVRFRECQGYLDRD